MNDLNLLFHSMFLGAALFIGYCLYLECAALFGPAKVRKQTVSRRYPAKVRDKAGRF
jgi:hypothetical protein